MSPLYKAEKKLFWLWGSWYSNRPARTHGFNAKIGFEKYVRSAKILPKKGPKLAFQTKQVKFDTFWLISRDSVHIFQNLISLTNLTKLINPIHPKYLICLLSKGFKNAEIFKTSQIYSPSLLALTIHKRWIENKC